MSTSYLSPESPTAFRSGYFSPTAGLGLSSEQVSLQTLFLEWLHLAYRCGEESFPYRHIQQTIPSPWRSKKRWESNGWFESERPLLAEAALATMGQGYGRNYLFCRPLGGHRGQRYLAMVLFRPTPSPKVTAHQH